MLQKFMTEK